MSYKAGAPSGGLRRLFRPETVAVIGASDRKGSLGHEATANALSSSGIKQVVLVNPGRERVFDRGCHASIVQSGKPADVAFVLVPAERCADVIRECGAAGVSHAIVGASGFGEGGKDSEAGVELRKAAAEAGVAIVGPNTNGLWNGIDDIHVGFNVSQGLRLKPGRLGLVSQSGAMLGSSIARLDEQGVGIAYAIATGNELELKLVDYLQFMFEADEVDAIGLTVDSITDPQAFARTVLECNSHRRKPVVLLQMGTSKAGAAATELHASRLADPADGLAFLMRKLGVAVTDNFDAYLSSLAILASGRNVPAERKVLGMSTSGAGAAILADIGEDAGLVFPSLSAEATQGLARTMRMTTPHNPLDLTGESRDPSWIEEVYAHFCASEPSAAVASLFTLLFDEPFDARAEHFARLAESQPDRLFLSATPAALQPKYMDRLKRGGVLTFSSISDLCAGLSLAIDARASDKVLDEEWLRAWAGNRPAMVEGGPVRALVHHEAAQAMAGHDIAFPESRIVRNDAAALASAARETGYPVALKLLSESRLHKATSNALAIGITSEEELVEAGRSMQPDPDDLFLVQKMVPAGLDVFVGTVRDATFGNLLIVGAGGGDVERARDTRTMLLPVGPEEVLRALGELRIAPALLARSPSGWVWDVDRLVATIMAFSRFVESAGAGEVMSAEINPLRVFESGAMAIDVRVMLSPSAREA